MIEDLNIPFKNKEKIYVQGINIDMSISDITTFTVHYKVCYSIYDDIMLAIENKNFYKEYYDKNIINGDYFFDLYLSMYHPKNKINKRTIIKVIKQ